MRSRRRRLRSHKLATTLVVLIALTSIGGAGDFAYMTLKGHADRLQASLTAALQAGQGELESGKSLLQQANTKRDATLVTQAIDHFVAAKSHFQSASQQADDSRFLHYLEYTPAVGSFARSRHTAIDGIAEMGAALADAGQDVAKLDAEIIKPASSGEAGHTLLTVLDVVHRGLGKVRTDLETAKQAAARVDVQVLPSGQQATFIKARASIDSALAGSVEFERLVPVLTEVLGGSGPRQYLIEQVNPAELRAGGGFISTYSLLQADQGSLKIARSGNAYDLANPRPNPGQPGFIPQPTPYREVIPDTSWSFVDSNIYPDFPSNARAALTFTQARVGRIDGVISMDYYTVAELMKLTGPMVVPGYGIEVNSGNFISEIMRYDLAPSDAGRTGIHKAILDALAGPLMQRVTSLSPDQWPSLLATLNGLAFARHLQVYFSDPLAEAELDRVGWSGRLNVDGGAEYMMEVESNYYGNKANYFLSRHYSIALVRSGNKLRHKVVINLLNNERCGTEERTLYRANVRFYIRGNAYAISNSLTPAQFPNPAPPTGTVMLDGWLLVNCDGGRGQAEFDYDTPWPNGNRAGQQMYWQKQPGTDADEVSVTWNDGNGATYHASGDLAQDKVITLGSAGVKLEPARLTQATLPTLSF